MADRSYSIRGGEEGRRRLDLLASVMEASTRSLLEDAGVGPGMRCADIGCGGGHVTTMLAGLVGPAGHVLGIDMDQVKIEAAQKTNEDAGRLNVEFRKADLTAWSAQSEYDVVYGRFIVSHLADRPALIARMRDALDENGLLILEDVEFSGHFCQPESPAFARYCELYGELIRNRGGDADVGSRLQWLIADAGLRDGRMRVVQPVHRGAEPGKEMALSTLLNISDALLAEGLIGHQELSEIVAELTLFTDDPDSVMSLPRVFQAWGRKTGAS